MQRWTPNDFKPRESALNRPDHSPDGVRAPAAGLLVTCSAECFAPHLLAAQLQPDAWLIHRTPAGIVPPFGTENRVEEELIEHAVAVLQVRAVVLCGHAPCAAAAQLLRPVEPGDDFLLRHWLTHAEDVRRTLAALPQCDERAAAERCVLAQLRNLMTHPAVAAAVALGQLGVWTWLYDAASDELLYPPAGEPQFTRLAALHPDQNAHLRRDVVRRPRPRNLPTPLDPRQLWLA